MPRVPWPKIAKELRDKYTEDLGEKFRCKVCGAEIPREVQALKTLSNIYKHFRYDHPDIVNEIRREIEKREFA